LLSENTFKRLTFWDSVLSKGVGAVAKRLAAEGKTSEALDLAAPNSLSAGWVTEAAAPYLSVEQVRDQLSKHPWSATSWRVDAALLARLAELGFAAEATGKAIKLPAGVARLSGIIAIGETLDPARAAGLLLEYIEDFTFIDYADQLWNCTRQAAPILAQLPLSDLMTVWQQFVGLISGRIRLQALPLLYLTSPIIVALGGSDAAAETFQNVVNVLRWFPSYPRVLHTFPQGGEPGNSQ